MLLFFVVKFFFQGSEIQGNIRLTSDTREGERGREREGGRERFPFGLDNSALPCFLQLLGFNFFSDLLHLLFLIPENEIK